MKPPVMKKGWLVVWPDTWLTDIVRTEQAARIEKSCGADVFECEYSEWNTQPVLDAARTLRKVKAPLP